jgi:hypothetical protein
MGEKKLRFQTGEASELYTRYKRKLKIKEQTSKIWKPPGAEAELLSSTEA